MKTKSILLLALLVSVSSLHAQQHAIMQWWASYDGPTHFIDGPSDAALDRHSNFYVTGRSYPSDASGRAKITTLRYSPGGEATLYEGYDSASSGTDLAHSIAVDDSGNAYVSALHDREVVLVHYSPAGRIVRVSHYPDDNASSKVVLDTAGNIYLGTWAADKIIVRKHNRQGIVIDSGSVSGDTTQPSARAFLIEKSGEMVIVGNRKWGTREGEGLPILHTEGLIAALDAHCHLLWEIHPPIGDVVEARLDHHGDIVIIDAFTIMKYSPGGELVWRKPVDFHLQLTGLRIDSRSRIIVSANTSPGPFSNSLVRYDQDGIVQWSFTPPDAGTRLAQYQNVVLDSTDAIYATGVIGGEFAAVTCLTVKVDTSGQMVWETNFSRIEGEYAGGEFIRLSDSGSVYVAGMCGSGVTSDFLAIKYDQGTGDAVVQDQGMPLRYALLQNYPNPFNPSTTIRYSTPRLSHVSLIVYNMLGQRVATLVDGEVQAGYHEVQFHAAGLASGVSFYRLTAGSFVQTRKLLLVR